MSRTEPIADHAPVEIPTVRNHPLEPPPELAALREQRPLCRLRYPDGHVGWLVTSYALGRSVLADPRFSMRPPRRPTGDALMDDAEALQVHEAFREIAAGSVIFLDPPDHTRLRRLQTGYLSVRRVGEHRKQLERIVAECLDAMDQEGPPVDLVEAFASQVPSKTMCELLGVPRGDRERFMRPDLVLNDPESSAEEKVASLGEFSDYVRSVIERKRAQPAEDLLSELVATGELTDEELVGVAMQLFSAGHDTTAMMLSLGTFALLCDREKWEALSRDPSLVENAVEELLRYLTIVQVGAFSRTALEDVELDGTVIATGESVTVSLTAANRDPGKFSDPDRLDPLRDASGHLAFGHGRHMCLGQHLARLELQVGLAGLTRRFPAMHLALSPEEVPMRSGAHHLYGPRRLPVAW